MVLVVLVHFLHYYVLLWVWGDFWFHGGELLYEWRLVLLMSFVVGLLLWVVLFLLFYYIIILSLIFFVIFLIVTRVNHHKITLRRHPYPIRLLRRRYIFLTHTLLVTVTIAMTKLQRYSRLRHVLIPLCLHMRHMTIIIMPYLMLIMLHMIMSLLWYRIHLLDAFLIAIKWWLLLLGLIVVYNIVVREFPLWWDIGRWWHWTLKVKCDHVQRWG